MSIQPSSVRCRKNNDESDSLYGKEVEETKDIQN